MIFGVGDIASIIIMKISILYMLMPEATGWTTEVRFLPEVGFLSSPPHPDQLWGPPSLLSDG
jgi:hypothetical protein